MLDLWVSMVKKWYVLIVVLKFDQLIGLTMPSASKLVDGLVRRGYLRRRSDLRDRRISILGPTAKCPSDRKTHHPSAC